MRTVSGSPKGFSKFNMLASAALAVMLAACSSSFDRFADNPSNADPVYTASVPKPKRAAAYAPEDDTITSRPLSSAPMYKPSYSYKKPAYRQPEYAEQAYQEEAPSEQPVYKKSAMHGKVRVEQGMTLYSIARANGLTVAQLARANNIAPPYAVSAGRILRIPGVSQAKAPKPRILDQGEEASPAGSHVVESGETLYSLGRKYGMSPFAIADLNDLSHDGSLSVGQSLRIPGGKARKSSDKLIVDDDSERVAPVDEETVVAEVEAREVVPDTIAPEPPATPAVSSMRWPVKGKVISEFGTKPNGLKNEGINIAVPEGTGVRAAESGVVAYAGNELKGYGNLVLIRHEGGWVTAYAHAKELFVKRGDTVKRGDVIAKAGQTGSVASPQLHFEVRKGATAMDPLKFLNSTTALN
jgi:murein DD-endopeptidase MepM/ murein hydrolase activator NlpD